MISLTATVPHPAPTLLLSRCFDPRSSGPPRSGFHSVISNTLERRMNLKLLLSCLRPRPTSIVVFVYTPTRQAGEGHNTFLLFFEFGSFRKFELICWILFWFLFVDYVVVIYCYCCAWYESEAKGRQRSQWRCMLLTSTIRLQFACFALLNLLQLFVWNFSNVVLFRKLVHFFCILF